MSEIAFATVLGNDLLLIDLAFGTVALVTIIILS